MKHNKMVANLAARQKAYEDACRSKSNYAHAHKKPGSLKK